MIGEAVDDDAEKGADFPGLSVILWFLDMHQPLLEDTSEIVLIMS